MYTSSILNILKGKHAKPPPTSPGLEQAQNVNKHDYKTLFPPIMLLNLTQLIQFTVLNSALGRGYVRPMGHTAKVVLSFF